VADIVKAKPQSHTDVIFISVTCRNINVDESCADRDHGPIGVQTINFDVEVKRKGCESEVDVDFDSTCCRRRRAPQQQQWGERRRATSGLS
jgi:hypothetical protein